MATITVDCAYDVLIQSSGISRKELRDRENFRNYVCAVYMAEEKWGHQVIGIDAFIRLQRKLDPNKEANGRRMLTTWPGPKVQQGRNRLEPRPRWDRRAAMTTGWEIEKGLSEYANRHIYGNKISSFRPVQKKPELKPQKPLKFLRGKDQYWDFLMN
jgi:hypothetical protein